MPSVLIVDDDKNVSLFFSEVIGSLGHDVRYALTYSGGQKAMAVKKFDVVFLDVNLPDGHGLELLPVIRGEPDPPEVIIITGFGDPEGAALAINNDAWDYIEKPASPDKIKLSLKRALQFRESNKSAEPPRILKSHGIIGGSSRMAACFESIANAADSNASVLITGETGTGKELVAEAIHTNSNRSKNKFIIVDCASLPETLIESVLFGHEKGAFTGADRSRIGLIKLADKGTLFLDEVGELPLSMQKKFLRVLETRRFRPVAGNSELFSDFRLVAATHRNLDDLVQKKMFRKDLFYRLCSIEINVAALRERKEDIKTLLIHHMNNICEKHGSAYKTFAPEVFSELENYDWPGNVRELFNLAEAIFSSARHESTIFLWHLPKCIRVNLTLGRMFSEEKGTARSKKDQTPLSFPNWEESKRLNELQYINNLLSFTEWNVSRASRISGIGRTHLYALIKKHKIKRKS